MNLNKFTIKAQEAVQEALNRVQRQGQQAIEPEHLLSGILKVGEQVTSFIFQKLGMNPTLIQQAVDAQIGSLPKVQGGEPYLSREGNEVLTRAEDIAQKNGDEFVSLEHMLQAGHLPEPVEIRPQSGGRGKSRETGSRHRTRRRNPSCIANPDTSNQEQSHPDRRARNRQDGHRGRSGPQNPAGRCA